MPFDKRVKNLRQALCTENVDALLVTNLTNIGYLTGFEGSYGVLLVTQQETLFITDFRYMETAQNEVFADHFVRASRDPQVDVERESRKRKIRRLGFESQTMSHEDYLRFESKMGKRSLIPLKDVVEKLRAVKEDGEIAKIRKAVDLTEQSLRHIRKFLEPGVSEKDLTVELEIFFKLNGGGKTDFQPIVAFGQATSKPHYLSSDRKLTPQDNVLIDLGPSVEGYHADLTRTWLSHSMDEKEKQIYGIVLDAQQAAIDCIRPGVAFSTIDNAARKLISKSGFSENFGHGLGHGIGRRVHELPRISAQSEGRCRTGMVFTIEPGVYLPGWGGVRIEDDILVTKKGCEVLSSFPKNARPFM
jgi:Xaa-Pro aminopeptidase